MTSTAAPSAPVIPPRPARSRERSDAPSVPARPAKRLSRTISPNPDRFAPSPLNEGLFDSSKSAKRISQSFLGDELEQVVSLDLPGVGEEGQEYAALTSPEMSRAASPEQTRIVAEDLKLHAPKPTVPAASAKQRVSIVTHTDSDRAAAFGIGRPSSEEPPLSGSSSLKKKASTTSQLSHNGEIHADDEHGIPEIGQRVPMLAFAGDVQAPSPAPPRATSVDSTRSHLHHTRRASSRGGFHDLPPGSYGLHGHGVESTDKLEKAYYEKHPDVYQKEHINNNLHGRVHDYSMSSENLNKIVRDTASRGVGLGTSEYDGTPSEQVGFEVSDEYIMRATTPQPPSTDSKNESAQSHARSSSSGLEGGKDISEGSVRHSIDESSQERKATNEESCPILASDEVAKDSSSSRPTSIYSTQPPEIHCTPLEDVEEYEPLFPDDGKGEQKPKTAADKLKSRQRFPSQDVWEDAPNSVHSTAEVLTPEIVDESPKPVDSPTRNADTPAREFARRQEELAEKEAVNPDSFLNRQQRPEIRIEHQPALAKELLKRPGMPPRFPSQDVWEDTPDSLQFTTTVSRPQSPDNSDDEATKSPVANKKPVVPARPPKKDDLLAKPTVPTRPKPQIPARPVKPVVEAKPVEGAAKPKPVVPARPVGGKIAALQAGFMSDLNNRLRLGPQAPKKEVKPEEPAEEEKAPAPLADARKGRARGPQRRAPTKAQSPSGAESSAPSGPPVLSFSMTRTLWSIDEEGTVTVDEFGPEKEKASETVVEKVEVEEPVVSEVTEEVHSKAVEAVEVKAEDISEEKDLVIKSEEAEIIEDKKVEEDKVEAKAEEHKIEVEVEEETESETSVNKTPASSEAFDVEETKSAVGESASTEKKDEEEI